jgi:hypothetical protein
VKITLSIPTINDRPVDFDTLFGFWNQVNNDSLDVTFDFSYCGFLKQNAVAFLGGLARLIKFRSGSVPFLWNTIRNNIFTNLAQNGFLSTFGHGGGPWTGNSIPYREDPTLDSEGIMGYLKTKWLGRGWLQVSEQLRNAIVGRVWEIYDNAFMHAQSPAGIYSCGQHYPRRRELKLTAVDFGVGIPSNVRFFFRDDTQTQTLSAANCLKWAFLPGKTTKPGIGRGMGLELLKDFVKTNKGKLEIFSHEGYAMVDEKQEIFMNRETFFEGTLVNITFLCDESYYHLASEGVEELIF